MKKFVLVLLAIVLINSETNGQDYAKKDCLEIGGSLAFTSTTAVVDGDVNGDAINQLAIYLPLNYFITDGLAVGLITSFELYVQGGSNLTGILFGVGASYNFVGKSNLIPYLESRLFYNTVLQSAANDDVTLSGIGWAVLGGLKVKVSENVLVNSAIGYAQSTLEDSEYDGDRMGTNVFALSSGFVFYFCHL